MAATLVFAAGAAHSAVLYKFDFKNLVDYNDVPLPVASFSVTLKFDDYVTTTGLTPVTPVASSSAAAMGYEVAYAGTNAIGWWGFDDVEQQAELQDNQFIFGGTSFLFSSGFLKTYVTAPGTYQGYVSGNRDPLVYSAFSGAASLTVSEVASAVPEPSALALLSGGLAVLGVMRRRQTKTRLRAPSRG